MTGGVGQGVVGAAELTHGTLETRQMVSGRDFYERGLGLRTVRHSPPAQLIAGASDIVVVCVETGGRLSEQGAENRWIVMVPDRADVARAHDAVVANAAAWGVMDYAAPTERDGETVFTVRDADSNWWEVTDRPADYYQALFERGDVA